MWPTEPSQPGGAPSEPWGTGVWGDPWQHILPGLTPLSGPRCWLQRGGRAHSGHTAGPRPAAPRSGAAAGCEHRAGVRPAPQEPCRPGAACAGDELCAHSRWKGRAPQHIFLALKFLHFRIFKHLFNVVVRSSRHFPGCGPPPACSGGALRRVGGRWVAVPRRCPGKGLTCPWGWGSWLSCVLM